MPRRSFPLSLLAMSNTTPFGFPIPTARKISPLRQRMIDDMPGRTFAPNTMVNYLKQVIYFPRHFGRSPERVGPEQIRSYQIYLAKEKRASVSTCTVAVSALRFLYRVTLKQDWVVEMIPTPKKEYRLPVILSPEEVLRLLEAAPSFSHRVIFSTMYGTGVRVSEALHLRASHIDSQRMMIRIQQGKGHKDRYVQLSLPSCWSCCARIGGPYGRSNGCSQDRFPTNRWPRGRRPSRYPCQPARWSEEGP